MYDLGLILNWHYLRFLPTNIMKSPLDRFSLSVCLLLCRRCSLATVDNREADRQTERQTCMFDWSSARLQLRLQDKKCTLLCSSDQSVFHVINSALSLNGTLC